MLDTFQFKNKRNSQIDFLIRNILKILASIGILVVILIFTFLLKEAFPFLKDLGFSALFNSKWSPVSFVDESFGIYPLILGTLITTVLAILISVPIGVITAIYLSELASPKEREFFKPFIEILSSLPSVVLGFFGLLVIGPWIKNIFNLDTGLSAFTGGIILAIMAIPTIISVSEDALRNVPFAYKEAAMSLGSRPIHVIWLITVPAALSGIVAAIMLGIGRIIGETMVVLMVTGNAPLMTLNPFESMRTMTATIAGEMGEVSFGSAHYSALFWIGIILLLITFCLVLISHKIFKKYGISE